LRAEEKESDWTEEQVRQVLEAHWEKVQRETEVKRVENEKNRAESVEKKAKVEPKSRKKKRKSTMKQRGRVCSRVIRRECRGHHVRPLPWLPQALGNSEIQRRKEKKKKTQSDSYLPMKEVRWGRRIPTVEVSTIMVEEDS
jgi:hypothetical protein